MRPFALSKLEEPRKGLLQLLDEQWSIGGSGLGGRLSPLPAATGRSKPPLAGGFSFNTQLQFPAPNLLQWGAGIGVSRRFQLKP